MRTSTILTCTALAFAWLATPATASAGRTILLAQAAEAAGAEEAPSAPDEADEPASGEFEEIVVVGQESAAAEDYAAGDSVTGFNADDLEALGAQSVADLGKFTPNLEIVTSSATTPTFFIRGVGLNDFASNSTGAVAIYVDDVPINAPPLQLATLFDMEGVNILRGPQSTGANRNASAGAIRIRSRRPSGTFGGYFKGTGGSYDYMDYEGAVESPIVPDILSNRTSFRISKRDGWMRNRCGNRLPFSKRPFLDGPQAVVTRSAPYSICGEEVNRFRPNRPGSGYSPIPPNTPGEVNDLNVWAARSIFLFEPTLDQSWTLNLHGSQRNEDTRLGQTIGSVGFINRGVADNERVERLLGGPTGDGFRSIDIDRIILRKLGTTNINTLNNNNEVKKKLAIELANEIDRRPRVGEFNRVGPTENDVFGVALTGDIAIGNGVELRTTTGYDQFDRLVDWDLDFSPDTAIHVITDDEGYQIVQDMELNGYVGESDSLRWAIGAWFLKERLDVDVRNDFGLNLGAPTARNYTQELWSTAGWFRFEYDFFEDFTLDGGVRWNYERKDIDYLLERSNISDIIANEDDSWDAPTGSLRLVYRFRQDTQAYWKISRGWKPGTFNATGSLRRGVEAALPEELDAYEMGIQGSWFGGIVNLNVSLFYYNYRNYQIFTVRAEPGAPPEFVIINANDAEVYGSEIDMVLRPWRGSFINARFSWLQSEYLDFVQEQLTQAQDPNNPFGLPIESVQLIQNSGNRLLNSPEFKLSLTAEQRIDLGRFGAITARWDGAWTDDIYFDAQEGRGARLEAEIGAANNAVATGNFYPPFPSDTFAQRSYWTHNIRVTYTLPGGSIELAGFCTNCTDVIYKTFAFDASAFAKQTIHFLGEPRVIGGSFTARF